MITRMCPGCEKNVITSHQMVCPDCRAKRLPPTDPTPTPTPRTCSVCNGYNAPDRLPCPECQGCGLHDCRCSLDAALATPTEEGR